MTRFAIVMGVKIGVSEISRLIIYYILIISTCFDISLINCDIHKMRQSSNLDTNQIDFKINATELEQHIMSGLNITKKPDVDMVSLITEKKSFS
jgi:hypothetical protein